MKTVRTLCLIVDSQKILLGQREGKWGGFGGEVKEDEEAVEGAKRKLWEELGIQAKTINLKGIIDFECPEESIEVHIFKVLDYSGSFIENKEIKLRWFDILEIPFGQMQSVDLYWLPLFLKDKKFKGKFIFKSRKELVSHDLEILND